MVCSVTWLRKNWKTIPVFLMATAFSLLVLYLWASRLDTSFTYRHVTADQRYILRALGPPPRFTVQYLPLGDASGRELARTEVWYYPQHGQGITFVKGQIAGEHTISVDPAGAVYPALRPWQVDVTLDRSEVESMTGQAATPLDLVPALQGRGGVEAFVTKNAVFAFEGGRLVYFQSLGRGTFQ